MRRIDAIERESYVWPTVLRQAVMATSTSAGLTAWRRDTGTDRENAILQRQEPRLRFSNWIRAVARKNASRLGSVGI
ncbi:MAG: hypothetical protein JO333_04505 [Verrucomicrobia bacterium]|nr:hypothetical protein [Verrucomicrobiota bacterium]